MLILLIFISLVNSLSWNLSSDMARNISINPATPWSFMKIVKGTNTYVLLDVYNSPCYWVGSAIGPSKCWQDSTQSLMIASTLSGSYFANNNLPSYITLIHPQESGDSVLIRWKSVINGFININGELSLIDKNGVSGITWYIKKGSYTYISGSLITLLSSKSFVINYVEVRIGDSIDFIVTNRNGNANYDSTRMEVFITTII